MYSHMLLGGCKKQRIRNISETVIIVDPITNIKIILSFLVHHTRSVFLIISYPSFSAVYKWKIVVSGQLGLVIGSDFEFLSEFVRHTGGGNRKEPFFVLLPSSIWLVFLGCFGVFLVFPVLRSALLPTRFDGRP